MSQPRVVVVGLGAMGAAAAFHLSRRGAAVIGLEARAPGHRQGASHGQSRIIRKAYYEDPCYVPLVLRAYDLWRELEQASGEPLLELTGGLMIGPPDGEVVAGSSASARQWGIYHRLLTAREIHHEFPQLAPERDDAGLFEPEAGALAPGPRAFSPDWACHWRWSAKSRCGWRRPRSPPIRLRAFPSSW